MTDTRFRYSTGIALVGCALVLLYLGQPIWGILPAVAAVYILGSLLYDLIFKG